MLWRFSVVQEVLWLLGLGTPLRHAIGRSGIARVSSCKCRRSDGTAIEDCSLIHGPFDMHVVAPPPL